MSVRYKIVREEDRKSYMAHCMGRYGRTYNKGDIVYAHPDSLGIFCFKRKGDAELWMQTGLWAKGKIIIRVEAFGRGRTPKRASAFVGESILDSFYGGSNYSTCDVAEGTICYDKVKVLD